MSRTISRAFGQFKLATQINLMMVVSLTIATAVFASIIIVTVHPSTDTGANDRQLEALRAGAAMLAASIPAASAEWLPTGGVFSITRELAIKPEEANAVIGNIEHASGVAAQLYNRDSAGGSFTLLASSPRAEGVGDLPGAAKAAFEAAATGARYRGPADAATGMSVVIEPIKNTRGGVLGALVLLVPVSPGMGGSGDLANALMLATGIGCAVALGIALVLSRLIARPIPRLNAAMQKISQGQLETPVPYLEAGNEIGEMARAVEVSRGNALQLTAVTAEGLQQSERSRDERAGMMKILQDAFGEVVEAANEGDYSKRVTAKFADRELNALAEGVNKLVETVDRGISETGQVLAALAKTDLTKRVRGTYEGAFKRLKMDTNAVAERLNEIVGQLKAASATLRAATGDVLAGAGDLSDRSEKQSANIEKTSAAMSELAATVAQNAERAQEANTVSDAVTKTALESHEVIGKATQAMERITVSSGKISNIIGLIDDVAFQTNLLALNASVEAARAGEAGKGFAVVAIEVRRLAQSAAEASAQVRDLIEQSASEVRGGSALVSEAARKLEAMVEISRSRHELMSSIAKESQAQAASIEAVNSVVREMDEMTQRNTALVGATTAAIARAEAQAVELDRIVYVFTVEGKPAGKEEARAGLPGQAATKTPPALRPAAERSVPPAPKPAASKPAAARAAYLAQGNAAVDADWTEF